MFRRYTVVRQTDQSDCGAAALATVALHHGVHVALPRLREMAGTARGGATLLGLQEAAEGIGLSARGVRGEYDALPAAPLPAIAHVRNAEGLGHFVVLHRVESSRVVIADPARGVETLTREEFTSRWSGFLLLLHPSAQANSEPSRGPLSRLVGLLSGHLGLVMEAVFAALLMALLGLASAWFIQHLVDGVLARGEKRLLDALGVGMALALLFRSLFGVIREYLLIHLARKLDLGLVAHFLRHVLRLPLPFFESRRVGDILSRVHDASKVREAVSGVAATALVDAVMVAFLLAALWWCDVWLALLASAFLPLLVVNALAHQPAARRLSAEAMERGAALQSHLAEDAAGIEAVKSLGLERRRAEEGEDRLAHFTQSAFRLQLLGMSMNGLGLATTSLAGLAVLWYGGHRVIAGAITVGELMFFHAILSQLLDPLGRLSVVNLKLQDALAAMQRLADITDLPPEAAEERKARFEGVRRGIELRGVGFRYPGRPSVLDGLDLSIPAGKTVAVVGESGSGKSTLVKLLLGFLSPGEGRIEVDGVDLRDLDLASLRGGIGHVSQEPFVFNGTLFDNIALGRPGATLAEVAEAGQAAGLGDLVASLPQRWETMLGDRGANLSGGQRQRLAIARALIRKPELLLFDEATSHLDTNTERSLQQSLRGILAGRTALIIAHRLSTVQEADLIHVLHQGRVAESGTHQELLALKGRYAALWAAQIEGASDA
jgi:ATP-binding cassette subfamily B protein